MKAHGGQICTHVFICRLECPPQYHDLGSFTYFHLLSLLKLLLVDSLLSFVYFFGFDEVIFIIFIEELINISFEYLIGLLRQKLIG